jgi:transcriptional regulator with XRE-family HTH domain
MRRRRFHREAVSKRFGENFFVARRRADLSRQQVSERSGVDRVMISNIEQGDRCPGLDTLIKFAGAVEVEPCESLAGLSWRIPVHGQLRVASAENGAEPPESGTS